MFQMRKNNTIFAFVPCEFFSLYQIDRRLDILRIIPATEHVMWFYPRTVGKVLTNKVEIYLQNEMNDGLEIAYSTVKIRR